MATEENDKIEVDMSAENNITGINSDNVVESEQQSQSYSSKQHAEMLLKLRREKRTRKTKMNDMKLHKEIMQESDSLELEIQQIIDSAQKMLVASPQVLGKDNPVDTEPVLLTGRNDLSTESNNNLQTEVQTPSHQDPTPSSQTPIPPGTQTTTLPYQSPSFQTPIPPGTQTTTLPYQSPSSQTSIPPGTQTTTLPYQSPSYQTPFPPGTQTTILPYQSPSSQTPIPPGTQTTTLPYQSPSSQTSIPPGTQTTTLPYQSPSYQTPIPPGTQTTTLPYQSPGYHPPIPPGTQTTTLPYPISPQMQGGNSAINRHLKALRVPVFDGTKAKFEEFWSLFLSLVDASNEPINLKMTKFGGQRRQLRAYMDELDSIPALRYNDVDNFERFADLVRVAVVKLKAENRQAELGEGTLHNQLVRKLHDRHLECYSRRLNVHNKEPAVTSLCDWLKEEVVIKIEAKEMAHGLDEKLLPERRLPRGKADEGRPRSYFTGKEVDDRFQNRIEKREERTKPPCVFCGQGNHGIWNCNQFKQKTVGERWKVAKEKYLCFRCLSNEHRGKDCRRTRPCDVDGCQLTHHRLLHDTAQSRKPGPVLPDERADPSREGAESLTNLTMTSNRSKLQPEATSLRTVPVWVKANGKKVKVNAVLDDSSNESFMNEEVSGLLGLRTTWQTVQ
ncbi:Hypothetical predicted protein, partial [Paramuricea clavata]